MKYTPRATRAFSVYPSMRAQISPAWRACGLAEIVLQCRRCRCRSAWAASRATHCRFFGRTEGVGPMALTAVSRLVVVDGDSFLDALFASAGQDRQAMEHRPQDRGPRRRTIDWQLDDRGALEARLGNVLNEHQVCNSNLIRSL